MTTFHIPTLLPDNFLSLLDIVCFLTLFNLYITEGCRIQH